MISKIRFVKLILDLILFFGFIAAFFLKLTGLTIHQWLGIGLGIFCTYHLLLHWAWVKSVTRKFFNQTSTTARIYYLLDFLLFISFGMILVTGLIISSWLHLWLNHYGVWKNIHVISSIITLVVLVLKILLHWRWVVISIQTLLIPPKPALSTSIPMAVPYPPTIQVDPLNTDRRHFLSLMGILGASTLLAVSNIAFNLKKETSNLVQGSADPTNSSSSYAQLATQAPQGESSSPTTVDSDASNPPTNPENCAVLCNNRCSYPGRCRRYVDNNGNGKCDNGECL